MWIFLAILSALCLGFYDISKKRSLRDNSVLKVLFLNTLFCTILMSPVIVSDIAAGHYGPGQGLTGHAHIAIKAVIVLTSWILGYFSIKHLPLTIAGPVNASRPVMVLVGAVLVFGERLNALQWCGVLLGFASLFFISRIGGREGFSLRESRWLWLSIGAAVAGAVSALYDKWLLGCYEPRQVQAWYSLYQLLIMGGVLCVLMRGPEGRKPLQWRWSIVMISVFLTVADMAYFYALSLPESMIAIVSMLRRGSVIVSFIYGVIVLREKDVKAKLLDLGLLLVALTLLVIGSYAH